ncbi:MAG: TOBE domain-containing protein [Deltaproteobacteria bacterium]|jgi:molybdate transport system regulatory protein|nr:TOBE domain-containing protein [Deltaproteobacteria bacterium]
MSCQSCAISSARNQLAGKISQLTPGAVNTEVILDLGGGSSVAAIITNESAKSLNLAVGQEACALFKASWVIVTLDKGLKTSARNQYAGKVKEVKTGAVNSEVILELPGGQTLVAIITNESATHLGLKPGVEASALIKASHIIIGVK